MKNIQLVIPMAGDSRLFNDAGYEGPKWLIDVDGKPMEVFNVFRWEGSNHKA